MLRRITQEPPYSIDVEVREYLTALMLHYALNEAQRNVGISKLI